MLHWITLSLLLGLLPAELLPEGQPTPPPPGGQPGGEAPLAPEPLAPRITGPTKYEPHSLVRLKAEGVDTRSALLWRIHPSKGVQRASTTRGLLEFAAHPGTYEVELLVITQAAAGLDVQEAHATITVDGCTPPAPPLPPGPPTPPTPPPGKKPDPMAALGRIQFGNAGCTATVIGPQRQDGRWVIATAAHCISSVGQQGNMQLRGGRKFFVQVIAFDRTADLAWLITTSREDDLPFANLASQVPPIGTPIWHAGYGIDNPGNREEGTVIGQPNTNNRGQINMMLSVSSGDSGGGIFRSDTNELISTCCCTAFRGARASMWGGPCTRLRTLLNEATIKSIPDPNGLHQSFDWTPIEIPLVR